MLVGLGESGLACARWLCGQGASLTVIDSRDTPPGLAALQELHPDVRCYKTCEQLEAAFDRVVVSPGLSPTHPLMQDVLKLAAIQGACVESELDLFADALQALAQEKQYRPKVIGITGTNGKTTTTRMVTCMARFAGLNALAAGNVSPAALAALSQAIANNELPDLWVLELSSFQLHWTNRLVLDAAAILNITQDHLDWHASMEAYVADKARLFQTAHFELVNREDALVAALPQKPGTPRASFGTNAPTVAGDFGLVREGGLLWLAHASADKETQGTKHQCLMPVDAMGVQGLHNASNGLAALALAQAIGLPMATLLHGLRTYKGEPHRTEFVMQVDGIDFFDDSKGTNVGASVAALKGLARACVLIAGGEGKGQDFTPLIDPVKRFCVAVLLIGKDASLLNEMFSASGLTCELCDSLEAAVVRAFDLAKAHVSKPCVLLSPACASLDMFRNYEHRAEVFVHAVQGLAADRGLVC